MLKWPTLRDIGRDILLTGTGLVIVWSQLLLWVFQGRAPDTVLMAVGLAMLYPTARAHVKTVLGSPEAGSSSPSSPSASSPPALPSPPPEEGTGHGD